MCARRRDGTYDNVSFSFHPGCDLLLPQTARPLWENTRGQTEAVSLKVGMQQLNIGSATRRKSCDAPRSAACFLPFILNHWLPQGGGCGTVLHSHSLPGRRRLLTSPGPDWKMRSLFHVCQESLKAARNATPLERRCDVLAEHTAALWDDACHGGVSLATPSPHAE